MKTRIALALALVSLATGCAESLRITAGTTTQIVEKKISVEQMVASVPLVFYGGSAGAGVLFKVGEKVGMITAAHVLSDSDPDADKQTTFATKMIHVVGYKPGTEAMEYTTTAKLVTLNPDEDWAVLEIAEEKEGMKFSSFADHLPHIGEGVWAVGSPMFDAGTVSRGVICHPWRTPAVGGKQKMKFIHTDAAGTMGSSGGGLFTDDGLCVGIVVRRNPMNDTMYAVPTRTIQESICGMFLPPDPMPPFLE